MSMVVHTTKSLSITKLVVSLRPYDIPQTNGKDIPCWNEAVSLAKEILDNETNGIIQTKLISTPEPASSSSEGLQPIRIFFFYF